LSERRTLDFGPLQVDRLTSGEALGVVERLVREGRGGAIFTPNVDHVVLAEQDARMRAAYARADLSLVDGMPLVWASRLLGAPVPEKISGSDFTPKLLDRAASRGWRVYFLGGAPGVVDLARSKLRETLPALQVVGVDSPKIDSDEAPERTRAVADRVRAAAPQVVLVALGAPKQEIWIDKVREGLRPIVFMAVGASLDFIAGTTPRAPAWISRTGLEWLFRLALEPRRLSYRYLVRDPRFLPILARAVAARVRRPGP